MITVIAKSVYKKEKLAEALTLYAELTEKSRKEKGCISYTLYEDNKNPCCLTMIEEWESEEILQEHFNTAHFKEIVPKLQTLREGTGEINVCRKVL